MRFRLALLILAVASGPFFAGAAGASEQHDLEVGPYAVGYRVDEQYDYSRTFRSQVDYYGKRLRENNARPVLVSVWYPAEAAVDLPHMTLSDYLLLTAHEVDFSENPETDIKVILRRFGVDPARVALEERSLAQRDAPVHSGSFPLVLYAPSLGSSPAENIVLCELLASHGYVVAASPAVGMFDRKMVGSIWDLYAQVEDLAFLSASMRSSPIVDMNRVGTVGFSWGGLSNVVLAMLNSNVKAVVSLDGSISFKDHKEIAERSFLYNPATMRVPFMLVTQSPWRYAEIRDFSAFDDLDYSDVFLVYAHDLVHMHFASTFVKLFGFVPSEGDAPTTDEARIQSSYHVVCRYTLEFLNAFLKGSEGSREFLERSPRQNGIPEDVLSVTRKKALVAPPMPDQFAEILRTEGVATASRIFRETRALNPGYAMFQPGTLIQLSAELEATGNTSEAIAALELAIAGAPESYHAYDRLANLHAAHGEVDRAVQTYERFMKANPDSVYATIAPAAIKGLQARN